MSAPSNPHQKDAEAAGKWVLDCLAGKPKKGYRDMPADTIAWVARWAGHWGNLALEAQ